jgi:ABC-2 type transport system ATP-binding protein
VQLSATGLSHTYGAAASPALSDVGVTFTDGVTAVVGVNGAGKSTLLRILARILRADAGEVRLDGEDIHRARPRAIASRIALMPQDFALPAGTRVLDGLVYLAWLKGVPAEVAVGRSEQTLAALDLGSRAGDKVSALSGGMLRRLALAQALVAEPDVLLLDEPTTGLDPEQRVSVRSLLAVQAQHARITLVSSHVMEDIEALADDVLLLNEGRVVFAGSLVDFCSRPDGATESAEAAFLRRLLGARS